MLTLSPRWKRCEAELRLSAIEDCAVLDVYKRPYNPDFPVICMDETPRQLIKETRTPIIGAAGRSERHDYEDERCGVCNVFMATEPLAGKRLTKVTERRTKCDWAFFVREIAKHYEDAEKITLVMDNLNTHKAGSLYGAFRPQEAKRVRARFEFVYTPKRRFGEALGSWPTDFSPHMAEIELNVLIRQCLNRRMASLAEIERAVSAWQTHRDNLDAKIDWPFTTAKARIKLRRLYPTIKA